MKKFFIIVNSVILLFFLTFPTFSLDIPKKVTAQSPTISQSDPAESLNLLRELLRILFSFSSNPPSSNLPTPTRSINPSLSPSTSPTITLPFVPTVTPDISKTINDVNALVDVIKINCLESGVSGRVTINNYPCLDKINPPLDITTNARLKDFVGFGFDHLQCVGFARASSVLTTKTDFCTKVAGAIDCPKDPGPYNFYKNTDRVPIKKGDFAVWDCLNPYGHIAYVTEVYDENNITVAEANWDGQGTVQKRNVWVDYNPRKPSDPKCKVIGWLTL